MRHDLPCHPEDLAALAAEVTPRLRAAEAAWRTLRAEAARRVLSDAAVTRLFWKWSSGDRRGYRAPLIDTHPDLPLALIVDALLFASGRGGRTPLARHLASVCPPEPLPRDLHGTRILWGFVEATPAGLAREVHIVRDMTPGGGLTLLWSPEALPPRGFCVAVRVLPDPQDPACTLALAPPVPLGDRRLEEVARLQVRDGYSQPRLEPWLRNIYADLLLTAQAPVLDLVASIARQADRQDAAAAENGPVAPARPLGNRDDTTAPSAREEIPRPQPNLVLSIDRLALDWAHRHPDATEVARARGLASAEHALRALEQATACARHGPVELGQAWDRLARLVIETLVARHRAGIPDCAASPAQLVGLIRADVPEGAFRDALLVRLAEIRASIEPTTTTTPTTATRTDPAATERLLARIGALQARTLARGCSEQEAGVAAERLARLLERHGDLLDEDGRPTGGVRSVAVPLGRRTPVVLLDACGAVAEFVDCRAWVEGGGHTRRAVYLGLPADVAAAEALHGVVATVLATELRRYKAGSELTGTTPARRARATRAFATGLVLRVAERLLRIKAARRAERLRSSGRDLVEQKLSLIDAELERLGLDLVPSEAGRRIPDRRAFWLGLIAGDGFDPHARPEADRPTGLLPPARRPPAG